MPVCHPLLVHQRHLAVVDVHRGAALMPAGFRTEHRGLAPGDAVVVAARYQEPAGMPYHVEGRSGLEEDLVHHGDAGAGVVPVAAAVVGEQDPDLVAGLVVAEVGGGAVQPVGAWAAVIDRHHESAVESLHYAGRVEEDAVGAGGCGDDFFIGDYVCGAAARCEQQRHQQYAFHISKYSH